MGERTGHREFPIDPRLIGGVFIVLAGMLGVRGAQSFQEVPEATTANELTGTGYQVTRSELGHNLLIVKGLNRFPAADPLEGVRRGRERIERDCGPAVKTEELGPTVEATNAYAYVEVFDASKCFSG